MTNVAIIHYSSTGTVHRLAEAAARTAEKAGAQVRLLKVPEPSRIVVVPGNEGEWERHREATRDLPEATTDDLEWADAVLFGTPVRWGMPAHPVLRFLDTTADVSHASKLVDKVVSVFVSGSGTHGGLETAILSLHNALCHWGALIVPTGSLDPVVYQERNCNPYGTSSVSMNIPGNVHEQNLALIEAQTERVVRVARTLAAGRAAL